MGGECELDSLSLFHKCLFHYVNPTRKVGLMRLKVCLSEIIVVVRFPRICFSKDWLSSSGQGVGVRGVTGMKHEPGAETQWVS